MEDGPAEPRTSGGSPFDAPRKALRESLLCARVAKKSRARRGRRKKSQTRRAARRSVRPRPRARPKPRRAPIRPKKARAHALARAPTRARGVAKPGDLRQIEAKWQSAWERERVYVARADPGRPKWYSTVPYPYMNGYQHLGFGTSFLRAEFQSRFRRMLGCHVLHPQAFHCTGLPILGAAKRIAEKEPKQWEILRAMGIPDREVPKFADPMHWIEVFPAATMEDLKALGAALDWTRSFITTPLNPPYDAFVRWQFHRLKDGGYVRIDKHPVIWCPKDQAPIGDHDRLEGEGETPMEYTLLKFPLADGRFLVAATIRPETVFGQTNLWVDPDAEYVVARVGDERWILNDVAAKKLSEQGKSVAVESRIHGAELLGKDVLAPAIDRAIPILPSSFIDQGRGTGIVTSVPSDAPDDYVALRDLQQDDRLLTKYELDAERIRAIQPIPIIRTPGWGPLPGVEIVDRLGIRNQRDREKLEQAKAEVYKTGFYRGVLNENCGPFAGVRVEVAKEEIRKELTSKGLADLMYEPSGVVICRCMTPAIVKVVDNQWFLSYADPAWKAKVHEAIASMDLYPEDLRNTGKDLVQNHMTFCLFAHTAIFPKEQWPRGFGVNGWVRLAGRKMSKSRGNVWYIREAVREWGADVIRLTVANAGDGLDDPNVDMDFAESAKARIGEWLRFATAKHASRREHRGIDAWFLSVLNRSIQASRTAMEGMNYKAVLRHGYFDLQAAWSWYVRRSEGRPHADVLRRFIDVQTKLLAPFVPHVAEEIWHRLHGEGFVVDSRYPEAAAGEVDPPAEAAETLLQSTLADVREILKVTGIAPKRLALYTAPAWKIQVQRLARDLAKQGPVPMNVLMDRVLAQPGMRERAKEVAAFAKKVAEDLRHAKPDDLDRFSSIDEFAMFRENLGFLGKELRVTVDVFRADDPKLWDPAKKADHAVPGRPAIYVE